MSMVHSEQEIYFASNVETTIRVTYSYMCPIQNFMEYSMLQSSHE